MTEETKVIHTRLPKDLRSFVEKMAKTTEYHNGAHVVLVALQKLKEYHDEVGSYPKGLSYNDRIEYNKM